MSYMQFQQKCGDCGETWNAAFGIVGTTQIAAPPTECPKCGSKNIHKFADGFGLPQCCHRDTDGDGNCDIHAAPGVLRSPGVGLTGGVVQNAELPPLSREELHAAANAPALDGHLMGAAPNQPAKFGLTIGADPLTAGFNALAAFFQFLCTPEGQKVVADVRAFDQAFVKLVYESYMKIHDFIQKKV